MSFQIIANASDDAIVEFNKKLGTLKSRLTIVEKFLNKEDNSANEHEFRSRAACLGKVFVQYEGLVDSFSVVVDEEKLENFHTVFEEFEDRYHNLISRLELRCESLISNLPVNKSNHESNDSLTKKPNIILSKSIKLPEIKIPFFDGNDMTQWITFRDTYVAVIHNNDNLDEIVKFTYLLDKLRGNAKESIGHITLTKTGYEKAWETLLRLYDHPRVIVDKHIEALLDLDPIVKRTESELRKLLNGALSHISSLGASDLQLDSLSQLIVLKIINRKLDGTTRGEWEESIDHGKQPTWEEFKSFLEKKCRVLREVEKATSKPVNAVPTAGHKSLGNYTKQSANKPILKRESSYFSNQITSNRSCNLCSKATHPYFLCPIFNNLTPKQRYEKIKEAKACINCLNPNHKTSDCRSIRCKICNSPHHTLLHFEYPKQHEPTRNITQDQNSTATSSTNPPLASKLNYHSVSNSSSNFNISNKNFESSTILPTALVMIEDGNGKLIQCRALLDSGSQTHFISESFAKTLNLKHRKDNQITVTYGTASAPYLATRVLNQLAYDEREQFPLAANIATKDFYVDDLITGSNDLKTAKTIQIEII